MIWHIQLPNCVQSYKKKSNNHPILYYIYMKSFT